MQWKVFDIFSKFKRRIVSHKFSHEQRIFSKQIIHRSELIAILFKSHKPPEWTLGGTNHLMFVIINNGGDRKYIFLIPINNTIAPKFHNWVKHLSDQQKFSKAKHSLEGSGHPNLNINIFKRPGQICRVKSYPFNSFEAMIYFKATH